MRDVAVLAGAVFSAGGVCALVQLLLPRLLRRIGLVDVPGRRSSHSLPTPRGGGLALLAGLVAGVGVWLVGQAGSATGHLAGNGDALVVLVVLVAVVAGAVGLADDLGGLAPVLRACLQLLLGAAAGVVVAQVVGLSLVWVPVAALCLAAYVNAVNFMDGANTVTAGHGSVVGLGFALAGALHEMTDVDRASGGPGTGWLVPAGLLLAVVCAVYAPSNGLSGGQARMFLGDVGSYAVGAAVAVLAGAGFLSGLPLVTALAPLTVWLADTGHTLLLRAAAGEPLTQAHRTHAYQRLVDTGWSHRRVGGLAALATAVCSAAGLAVLLAQWLAGPTTLVLLTVAWLWVKLPAWRGRPSPWGAVLRARIRGEAP